MRENNCGSAGLTLQKVRGVGESLYGFARATATIGWFQYISGQ